MNILIADDHQLIIEAYKSFFSSTKFNSKINLIEANSCEEAYDKIILSLKNNQQIDLAILDYSMPVFLEKNILNGADICIFLQNQLPSCKILIVTGIMESITFFEIAQNIKPHGIASKSDINADNFFLILENILKGKKFQSNYVKKCVEDIWDNQTLIKEKNRVILRYLSKGSKLKEIANDLAVSEISIKKRVSKIRQSLNLNEDENLLKEAKSRGYI
ncbi:DNA-binding response regulator [Flavobacterium sp.]|jgi:DNA-binding NarL/FixJ family response regulator|uniref:DNA-binding response regulator n=1 Tax=Flavobacterium sp. TaxID=239 RepID=UPI0037C065B8